MRIDGRLRRPVNGRMVLELETTRAQAATNNELITAEICKPARCLDGVVLNGLTTHEARVGERPDHDGLPTE